MKDIITAPNAPAAIGPYSHAVLTGNTLYTSGQIPLVPETGAMAEGCIKCKTKQVFSNLKSVLETAGMDFSNVVKTTVFMTDLADFASFNEVYSEYFPTNPPARSCVQVATLPAGATVEIELIAVK